MTNFMICFMVFMALALTLAFCWIIDRERIWYYVAAMTLLETCNLFWLVFPWLK